MTRGKLILLLLTALLPVFLLFTAGDFLYAQDRPSVGATLVSETPASLEKKEKAVQKSWEDKLPEPDPAQEQMEGREKTMEGMVSGAGYNGLAVELKNPGRNDPSEIWFDYVKGLKLSGMQKLAELREGDTVSVLYKETKDGRRFLKEIRLIRKKPVEETPLSTEETEEETSEE